MQKASFLRQNTGLAIVILVFGILGVTFLGVGGVLFVALRDALGGALPTFFPLIFVGIGGAFFVVALVLLLRTLGEQKKRRAVISRGNIVSATVAEVRQNLTVTVNGRHPYVVECTYQDGPAGETYLLKSGSLWRRPNVAPGAEVPVFWDDYDKKHYTVDLSGLEGADVVDLR